MPAWTGSTGAALVSPGLAAIVLPLAEGQQQGWPEWTFLCLAASVPLPGTFAFHQRRLAARSGSPLINLALFRERAFSAGVVTSMAYRDGLLPQPYPATCTRRLREGRPPSAAADA